CRELHSLPTRRSSDLGDDVAFLEVRSTGLLDLDALRQFFVALTELELVHDIARQEPRIARIFNLHLAEHLVEDDLNVLVVDLHRSEEHTSELQSRENL